MDVRGCVRGIGRVAGDVDTAVWVVWAGALLAYLVGVMHRTSFGVAGLDAAHRFSATPAALSGFVVLQLLVYAVLQVPVGLLLDRFGGRAMVAAGALTMAAGQLLLALAGSLSLAIAARVLVGVGDALTFISALSAVTAWFPARRVPLMTQLTGLVGQLGQVLSAVPLAALLHTRGWTAAFLSAAGVGFAAALAVLAVVRDRPPGAPAAPAAPSPRDVLAGLRRAGPSPAPGSGCGRTRAPSSAAPSSGCCGGCPTWSRGRG
jgi:MFS family permease